MSLEYFSSSAVEADLKFEVACNDAGVESRFYTHPNLGPEGEPLRLGVCRIGPKDAANRLLVLSATHGVEGFAGAGIQTGWLKQCSQQALPDNTSLVMVHQLNPWGMAWNRREDAENIDIFRNLLYCEHPSEVDPLFDAVDDVLDLANWSDQDPPAWQKNAAALVEEHGMDRLTTAIRRGQHHRPNAMTYHGNGPSWSKLVLDEVIGDYLPGASHIAVLDIHTGFGAHGEGIVMSYDPPDSERHRRVTGWFEGDIYTPGADADIPDHRVQLPFAWIEPMLEGCRVTAEILEFGTYDPATIGEVFNANHHFHLFGNPLSPAGLEWGQKYRHFCYPETDEWKQMVWRRGREVIEKTLIGLNKWSTDDVT